jgi:hypothetical protein
MRKEDKKSQDNNKRHRIIRTSMASDIPTQIENAFKVSN